MKKNKETKPTKKEQYHPKEAVLENGKKDKRVWSYKPLRNQHLKEIRADAWAQRSVRFYDHKRKFNILLWSIILIEPIINVILFLVLYYTAPQVKEYWNWANLQWAAGWVGSWIATGILVIYLSLYIPIVLSMKIFCWELNGQIIVVYVGVIKVHLAIDSYIWDKKPKKFSGSLYGKLKDGSKLQMKKWEGSYQVVVSNDPVPTPII